MIKERIHTNAIYQHYKGNYYKVINIGYLEENDEPMIIYYRCDINGIYQSIREEYDHNEVIIGQPFIRPLSEWNELVPQGNNYKDKVLRFRFIKQL